MSELAGQGQRTRRTSRFEIEDEDGGTCLVLEWAHDAQAITVELGMPPGGIAEEPSYSLTFGRQEAAVLANWMWKVLDI